MTRLFKLEKHEDRLLDASHVDFAQTGLLKTSTLRLHLLYTISSENILRELGTIARSLEGRGFEAFAPSFQLMITIVDCGINNLRSVQKAFEHLGHDAVVTRTATEILDAERIVLPGVGAFGAAMKALRDQELVEPILEKISQDTPFLGVCLSLQLLFDWSEELGVSAGLGVLSGKVVRFEDAPNLKIPHMGWSGLHFPRESRLFAGVEEGAMCYFVHSYHALPEDPNVVAATGQHGQNFVAAIERDNLMAVQFHPEKSSAVGLKILDNFARI